MIWITALLSYCTLTIQGVLTLFVLIDLIIDAKNLVKMHAAKKKTKNESILFFFIHLLKFQILAFVIE